MVLADCEQSRCGHGTSSDVEQEYAADIVREVCADGEFSGSVNQRVPRDLRGAIGAAIPVFLAIAYKVFKRDEASEPVFQSDRIGRR